MRIIFYSLFLNFVFLFAQAYPVWDEQQQVLCDKTYKNIYNGTDVELLKSFVMHPSEKAVRQKYYAIRNCCCNLDKSWIKFANDLKHALSANAQTSILNTYISISGELQNILNSSRISVATAIWVYNIPFLTDKKLEKIANKGNVSRLNKLFNNYAESFIEMGDIWQ